MNTVKNITIRTLKEPKTWIGLTLIAGAFVAGDKRGKKHATIAANRFLETQLSTITLLNERCEKLLHRMSVQTLTLNAYDNLANTVVGGGDMDGAMDDLFDALDFIGVVSGYELPAKSNKA